MSVLDVIRGRIVGYDEKTGEMLIRAKFDNFARWDRRDYKEVEIQLLDSRPLSDRQRRCCYAMIRAIADWNGDRAETIKEVMKYDFIASLEDNMDYFSLHNAPMSTVAAFQKFLATFIVDNDVPTKRPMLEYVDDTESYIYACTAAKKCPICGAKADLHHYVNIGMGRDRDTIIHEGMEVLPLCREHHTEVHTIGRDTFMKKWHLGDHGIVADKTICKLYKLKTGGRNGRS